MIEPSKILKEHRITEKANHLSKKLNQYTFEVYLKANKTNIAQAVEKVFAVKVLRVSIINNIGKKKSKKNVPKSLRKIFKTKKAIVSLAKGNLIEIL